MLDRIDVKYFKLAVGLDNIGVESSGDISARCPVCGDSRSNKRKKRLHLYNKNGITNINCFNGDCPARNKTVYGFLKEFNPTLLPQYKRENFGNTLEKLANGGEDVFSKFKKKEPEKESEVLSHDLSEYLRDISESPEALAYLEQRGLPYNEHHFGKWYYGYQNLQIGDTVYPITDSVVIPLYYKQEMYGFYSRSIHDKTFYTYMHDTNIGYKLWNWFKIDKTAPVFIYEGIFDAIAGGLPNSMALMGAKMPEERLKELKFPVFVLDNDKTGLYNSLEYAKLGYKVYIQPDKYPEKDMNEFMLRNDISPCDIITQNLFTGISAEVRIKGKL